MNEQSLSRPDGLQSGVGPTSDTADYKQTFYGILNQEGDFWTPLFFGSELAAWRHVDQFWAPNLEKVEYCRKHFKIVPVRAIVTALAAGSRRAETPSANEKRDD